MSANSKLIKSKKRVKKFGEVYTPDWLVEKMLDLLPDEEFNVDKEFLEPACGNGNFLVAILKRKLKSIDKSKENELKTSANLIDCGNYWLDNLAADLANGRVKVAEIAE